MKKKESAGRDSLSWAGSNHGDGVAGNRHLAETIHQDTYKLHQIRHKLDDDNYVDGAVTRIANFLTSTLNKKVDHE
jgi:hypothetical protein